MPYKTEFIMPEVFLEHSGIIVYRIYRNDNIDEGTRECWFTLDPNCGSDESGHGNDGVFDVRRLPACPNGSPEPQDVIRHAIDSGYDDWTVRFAGAKNRPVDDGLQSWRRLIETRNLQPEDLDGLVHDCASAMASAINNGGVDGQIQYLLDHLDAAELRQQLRDIAPAKNA